MKRTIAAVMVGAFFLAGLALWALGGSMSWNGREIVMAGLALALVCIAVYA